MLKEIEIKNFRGIKNLKIDSLNPNINIFVGDTNSGKTSILEAIYLFISETPRAAMDLINSRNMIADDDMFVSFFYDYDDTEAICLNGKIDGNSAEIKLTTKIDNMETIVYPNTSVSQDKKISNFGLQYENATNKSEPTMAFIVANKEKYGLELQIKEVNKEYIKVDFITKNFYNNLFKNLKFIYLDSNKKDEFSRLYKEFDSNIKDILFIQNGVYVQKNNLKKSITFNTMGQGFQSYINIITSIIAGQKYIIIDEIENGIHFDMIENLMKNIFDLSNKYNIQFFITTHSKEFLTLIAKILKKDKNATLNIFNAYKDKENNINLLKYDKEKFIFNMENNNEIRE